ncbi:MAG: DUF721 domain-containing protein [Desulfovibrionaceae bacterium]|nr:DUF721 domain-containing protein [Desulfovibrionaceae bacterium]
MAKSKEDSQKLAAQNLILQRYRSCHPLIAQHNIDFQHYVDSMDSEHIQARLVHLWENWKIVLGNEELAQFAIPLGHKKTTLKIGCENSMLLQEIRFLQNDILERVNAFLFRKYFTKLEVQLLSGEAHLTANLAQGSLSQQAFATFSQALQERSQKEEPGSSKQGAKLTGKFLGQMDPNSIVAKCYAKFVLASQKDIDKHKS